MNKPQLRETLELLDHPLTKTEESTIKSLLQWDRETVGTIDGLLTAMWKAGQNEANKTTYLHLLDQHHIGYNIDPGDGSLWIDESDKDNAIRIAERYGVRELIFGVEDNHGT